MKRKISILSLIIVLLLVGCTPRINSLEGTYQSDRYGDDYVVQFAFQPEDNTFVEYISNREVDSGTYEKKDDNIYMLKSEKQNIEVILDKTNSFELVIEKLNGEKPIKVENIGKTPTYFSTEFDDVEEYKRLLDEE